LIAGNGPANPSAGSGAADKTRGLEDVNELDGRGLALAAVHRNISRCGVMMLHATSFLAQRVFSLARRVFLHALFIGAALMLPVASATAAPACGGSFDTWLTELKAEAAGKGISQKTIDAALNGITPDNSVLSHDRGQQVFKQSFEQFSGRMVPPRLTRGSDMLKRYGSVISRIEQQYGVPGPVVVAIWGLETDFGSNIGKFPTIRALTTLAFDCRRADTFRAELLDALRIVDRGDLTPAEMRGAWAGEIGQTQFMPSSYIKFAVDFDNNGRRDLLRSAPDVLASTANYLAGYGWKRDQDFAPGTANFAVIQQWNKSDVYARTIALFASQLAREP
jgi:membrane-bound lytic murein transglycosylase B